MTETKEKKKILILGSTGSVGRQAADVAVFNGFDVDGLSADKDVVTMEAQARQLKPRFCVMHDEKAASELKNALADTDIKVLSSDDGTEEMIASSGADMAVNSIMGFAGLRPTVYAARYGMDIALANKETLVAGGFPVMKIAREKGISILPVDSEHSAVFQCLRSGKHDEIKRIILTASGGPFYGKDLDYLSKVTPKMALCHPTWKMGKKITIDSATLINKGFEIIEACHLFSVPAEAVDVVVHRESIIHSMVEFIDNSTIAQLSIPDMRLCVRYALSYPDRIESNGESLDLSKIGRLTFDEPDHDTFFLLDTAKKAFREGGVKTAVLNAANEIAVGLFLDEKISFTDIMYGVREITEEYENISDPSLEDIIDTDEEVRRLAKKELLG